MKYLLYLFVLFPVVVQHSSAIAIRAGGKGGKGGKGGNNTGNNAGNNTSVGNNAGNNTSAGNIQTSLTLDPSVIAPAFAVAQPPDAGEVQSLQSTNNFINFCAGKTITNGLQVKTGSCNPAPMGDIPSTSNMPSAKFTFPTNGGTVAANKDFTISMAIRGMQTGLFTNAQASYFAAPQQLNSQGQISGHSHVVVEQLSALDQTTPTDPTKFAFFLGLNTAANNGILTADVTNGLPAGFYKLSSINTAANHQPVLVPIAQHGSLDDAVYFTVSANGASSNNTGGAKNVVGNNNNQTSSSVPPATSSNAGGKGGAKNVVGNNQASSSVPPATSSNAAGKGGAGGQGSGKKGQQGNQKQGNKQQGK